MRAVRLAFTTWLLVTLAACATAPVTDVQPGTRPALETDEAGLWQMVERDEFRLSTSNEVIRDPDLQNYLQGVLCRVTPHYCNDVRIYVLPSPMLNAWMMPNGTMALYTGLLLRLENEAQLAAIIGHEVAHYTRRHSLQRYRAWRANAGTLQTVASIVSAGAGVAAANANAAASAGQYGRAIDQAQLARSIADVGTAVLRSLEFYSIMNQLSFSREQESESDALGTAWMNSAGYATATWADVWKVMEQEEALTGTRVPTFLRGHPSPAERKRRIRAHSAALETSPERLHTGAIEYQAQIEPFRNAWLHYARQGLGPKLENALLERQREIGAPAGLVAFHEADMYRKRQPEPSAHQIAAAFEEALAAAGCPPEAFREYALALWDAGRTDEARAAFEDYLAADPDAIDHAMIRSYIEELR